MDIVKFGLKLEFKNGTVPTQFQYPKCKFNQEEHIAIRIEIDKLLNKQVIAPCVKEPGDFISPIFTRPKKDGSKRMILNLKKFNENIKYQHFKMESLQTALDSIKPNSFMTSVDLKDAFYSIPIYEPHQKYLKFEFDNKLYKYTCMPMGYGPSMRIFTKMLKPPFAKLRSEELVSTIYVDDTLLLGDNELECKTNTITTVNLLRHLGFTISPDKSVFTPCQEITFLGFILNSIDMTITLTSDKKNRIMQFCIDIINKPNISIRTLSCFIGNLVAAFPAVPYGRLFYRELECTKISALSTHKGNFDISICINAACIDEICWWKDNIMGTFKYINPPPITLVIFTDASTLGWGIHCNGVSNGGRWDNNEKKLHINALELLAIFIGIKSFCKNLHSTNVKIMSDNATAISYISNMGGTKSKTCNSITKQIWLWCQPKQLWLTPAFIPGKQNVAADSASRNFNEATEWMLNTNVFRCITNELGLPNIDLFASFENKQLKNYVAWKPDPEAIAIDAFSFEWKKDFFYIFPPFSLISKVLKKIQQDRTRCILIAPDWPTQPWYPSLMKIKVNIITIPPTENLLQLRNLPSKKHPLEKKMSLLACLINFQSQVRIFLKLLLDHLRDKNIKHILIDGTITVSKTR